ncbi:ubl carboxyl-terminal hydrolase 18 [Acanthochromis polyacanthus]|uniref:ubl carboxyl-terminal hydrolase 18 n=1 Tax=Acanthochromis polyacanthus TaxID=80966 RepID=UPI00223496AE|nr:ubl carboxyl-terminal hydrolase 18 [Acanthochromis polyacanthus]
MSARICRIFSLLTTRDLYLGMRGLTNYHLSCCVNTLLQTLSATWEILDLLERWEAARRDRRPDSGNVPQELKRVLSAMRGDLPQPAPHRDFLHCLDRNRIPLGMQHDAAEVFLSILNLMQQQLDDNVLALEIQNLYKISVETHVQCLDCASVQTRSSYMLSLPLHINEETNSLESCMTSFFEHQELRGINRCFCAQCGTKTTSKQGVKLLSLPRILCVHLKRFRNMHGSTRKLDCRVTFPETFDFVEIVQEAFSPSFEQNDAKYTLYAVVVHSGYAAFGHYTAYVRHRLNKSWYYADDSRVQQTSWEGVKNTYGGRFSDTAYMLMYRRDSKEEGRQPDFSG